MCQALFTWLESVGAGVGLYGSIYYADVEETISLSIFLPVWGIGLFFRDVANVNRIGIYLGIYWSWGNLLLALP